MCNTNIRFHPIQPILFPQLIILNLIKNREWQFSPVMSRVQTLYMPNFRARGLSHGSQPPKLEYQKSTSLTRSTNRVNPGGYPTHDKPGSGNKIKEKNIENLSSQCTITPTPKQLSFSQERERKRSRGFGCCCLCRRGERERSEEETLLLFQAITALGRPNTQHFKIPQNPPFLFPFPISSIMLPPPPPQTHH